MGCGASNGAAGEKKKEEAAPAPAAAPAAAAPPPATEEEASRQKARPRLPAKKEKTVDWTKIQEKLPSEKNPEDYEKRTDLFNQMDMNGNGYLSLAEVDKGLRDTLQVDEIFDCKPVIMRAFQAARQARKVAGKPQQADDYVERTEFRMLLVYLRKYFEIWQMFDDADASADRRVTLDEFKGAQPKLAQWGVKFADPSATFREMDTNNGGFVLFDEFSHWILSTQVLKAVEEEPQLPPKARAPRAGAAAPAAGAAGKAQAKGLNFPEIRAKLPTAKNPADFEKRKDIFNRFDVNGNGYLSLAEVDKGMRDILQLDAIFDCKPVMMRAFQAARQARKAAGKPQQADDYVERAEFRLLLVYLYRYFELFQVFDDVDTSDDRRVTLAEFEAAKPQLAVWGVQVTDAAATFRGIDTNGGGFILFDEFAAWGITQSIGDDVDDE